MARKVRVRSAAVYRVTYKSMDKVYFRDVAADSYADAVGVFSEMTGYADDAINTVARQDQRVVYRTAT